MSTADSLHDGRLLGGVIDKIAQDFDARAAHILSFYCACMESYVCEHSRAAKRHLREHGIAPRYLQGWTQDELANHHKEIHREESFV